MTFMEGHFCVLAIVFIRDFGETGPRGSRKFKGHGGGGGGFINMNGFGFGL